MRAINPIIQTPPQLDPEKFRSDATQTSTPAPHAGFSDTLHRVGTKPARKGGSGRGQHTRGAGEYLPASGNSSPQPLGASAPHPGTLTGSAHPAALAGRAPAAIALSPTAVGGEPEAGPTASASPGADVAGQPNNDAASQVGALNDHGAPAFSPDPLSTLSPSTGPLANTTPEITPPAAGTLNGAASAAGSDTRANQAREVESVALPLTAPRSDGPAGRNAVSLREPNSTGDSSSASADPFRQAGVVTGAATAVNAFPAASTPVTQVDTAAMSVALQANPPRSGAALDAPPPPAADPAKAMAGAPSLGASEVPPGPPAMATAAASTARLVAGAAGVAAEKKSHTDASEARAPAASNTAEAAGVALAMHAPSATQAADAPPSFRLNVAVNSPEFSQTVINHVATMFEGNVSSAKLQVNPPALGPIEVRIALQGEHAQVWMASHSAMTRDALQEAAPQLREMLSSQGFAQVSVDISQRSFQERTPMAQAYVWSRESSGASSRAVESIAGGPNRTPSGALDAYA